MSAGSSYGSGLLLSFRRQYTDRVRAYLLATPDADYTNLTLTNKFSGAVIATTVVYSSSVVTFTGLTAATRYELNGESFEADGTSIGELDPFVIDTLLEEP